MNLRYFEIKTTDGNKWPFKRQKQLHNPPTLISIHILYIKLASTSIDQAANQTNDRPIALGTYTFILITFNAKTSAHETTKKKTKFNE